MVEQTTHNILMYSHDTYGLGHIRRTMAIANHLADKQTNILILTGSPIAGRFAFPQQVDFVRIPGMIKKTNDEYRSLSIRIDQEQALSIRKSIIEATVRTFKPDLFIVDKEPLGLKKEVLPTLEWIREFLPETRTVLGLRDIMDAPETVIKDWQQKKIYDHLEKLYSEIWIYGNREVYNPVVEYNIPKNISKKVHFTGYIKRNQSSEKKRIRIRKQYRILKNDIMILVTTGGGGDGSEVMDHFLSMHDYFPANLPFKSILVTGPFMPKSLRNKLKKHARTYGIKTMPFHPRMEEMIAAADLVVSMGGYNTVCEILTQQTPALLIPRETPRQEQLIRAKMLKKQGLLDYIPWQEVTAQLLRQKIMAILDKRDQYQKAMASFPLSGLETIGQRIENSRKQ